MLYIMCITIEEKVLLISGQLIIKVELQIRRLNNSYATSTVHKINI